ncbi:MAG: hypothetical protein ACJAVK_002060 [Akkermansiaceae bacterium]|jgi:hypothetical protein
MKMEIRKITHEPASSQVTSALSLTVSLSPVRTTSMGGA